MRVLPARETRGRGSKFLACAFVALTLCSAVMLGAMLACLSMLSRVSGQMQDVLVASLNRQIDEVSSETGFSGSRFNVSDELLNNEALVDLGRLSSVEPGDALTAATTVYDRVIEQTQNAPGRRYLYFSASDYLMSSESPEENARGSAPAPVETIADELAASSDRITGSYENHVGEQDDVTYQLMVRTVADGIYYVVYFDDIVTQLPEAFSGFEDVQMYYYDQFGACAPCYGSGVLSDAYDYASLGDDDTGVVYRSVGGRHYIGVYCTSHTRNLRLAIFFVDDVATVRHVGIVVTSVAGVAVLAALLVTFVYIRKLYRPVSALARRIERTAAPAGDEPPSEGPVPRLRDDGVVIARAIDAYQSTVERQHDLLSASWLRRALCDDDPDMLGEYEDEWVSGLQGRPYVVVVVRGDGARDGVTSLTDVVLSELDGDFELRAVPVSDTVAAVVCLEGTTRDALVDALRAMQAKFPELVLSAFVGAPRTSLDQLPLCYEEANGAAEYCLSQEIYGVVQRFEDVSPERRGQATELEGVRLLPGLAGRVCALDTDGALEAFDEMVSLGRDAERARGVERDADAGLPGAGMSAAAEAADASAGTYLSLVTSGVALAFGLLADSDAVGSDEAREALRADASRMRSATSAARARRQLASTMRRLAAAGGQRDARELYESIEANLRTHYRDSDISAGMLARQAGIGQSQLTKLFKKYNGTTFLECLHGLRLSEASMYLRETSLTEGEIAQRVGYNNTISMIRAFKKYLGVVPSALRRADPDAGGEAAPKG
jgi:AraC-like DNA-binding protein